jgi:hypothetical protein
MGYGVRSGIDAYTTNAMDRTITVSITITVLASLSMIILWIRDRRGLLGSAVRRTLGFLSIFCGVVLLGGMLWIRFRKEDPIDFNLQSTMTILICTSLLILIGLKWSKGQNSDL